MAAGVLCGLVIAGILAAVPLAAPGSSIVSFAPTDDTYSSAGKANGSLTYLVLDRQPERVGYVRFRVSGVTQPIVRATLRLYAQTTVPMGYQVRSVASAGWSEETLTEESSPLPSNRIVAASGALAEGTWAVADVSAVVTGDGTYAFALTTTTSAALRFATKEDGAATAPQLEIETRTASASET
jgi:hypothetical protein